MNHQCEASNITFIFSTVQQQTCHTVTIATTKCATSLKVVLWLNYYWVKVLERSYRGARTTSEFPTNASILKNSPKRGQYRWVNQLIIMCMYVGRLAGGPIYIHTHPPFHPSSFKVLTCWHAELIVKIYNPPTFAWLILDLCWSATLPTCWPAYMHTPPTLCSIIKCYLATFQDYGIGGEWCSHSLNCWFDTCLLASHHGMGTDVRLISTAQDECYMLCVLFCLG